jgi:hypothetical protein
MLILIGIIHIGLTLIGAIIDFIKTSTTIIMGRIGVLIGRGILGLDTMVSPATITLIILDIGEAICIITASGMAIIMA